MKLNNLFSWMAASALVLSVASCQDNAPVQDEPNTFGSGSQVVTFNVKSESSIGTRADGSHISDGSQANTLFFQVYEVDEKGDQLSPNSPAFISSNMDFTKGYAVLRFSVEPDKFYKAAFWAQHTTEVANDPETTPFTVTDLRAVKVNYTNAKNNDEMRDAFCAASDIFSANSVNETVILHRPFAQINVGTTMADYSNYAKGNILPTKAIQYSKIVVKDVYNTLNVLEDKLVTTGADQGKEDVTFDFAALPAYYTLDAKPTLGTGTDDKYTKLIYTDGEELLRVKLNDPKLNKVEWWAAKDEPEQVDDPEKSSMTRQDNGFFKYRDQYPTMLSYADESTVDDNTTSKLWYRTKGTYDKSDELPQKPEKYYLTEEFKYLSMCYVLIPFESGTYPTTSPDKGTTTYDPYYSSTVSSVDVYFAEKYTSDTDTDGRKYFTLKDVPVHRNWRTNILGGLSDTPDEDTNDPTIPNDPSSLFYNVSIFVKLCPIYYGEYYETNGDEGKTGDWIKTEFPNGSGSLHGHNELSSSSQQQ